MRPIEDTHDRIDNIQLQLQSVHARLDSQERKTETILVELQENTLVTKEVRDIFTTARTTTKAVKWLASLAGAFVVIGGAWVAMQKYLNGG